VYEEYGRLLCELRKAKLLRALKIVQDSFARRLLCRKPTPEDALVNVLLHLRPSMDMSVLTEALLHLLEEEKRR
jgi:hypothetical protein